MKRKLVTAVILAALLSLFFLPLILNTVAAPDPQALEPEDPTLYLPYLQIISDIPEPSGQIVFTSWRSDEPYAYKMGFDGSAPTLVLKEWEAQYDPMWSPDNREIAASALVGYEPCENPEYQCAVWDIVILKSDGSQARSIKGLQDSYLNTDPVWSPDGSEIAFMSKNHPFCDYAYILKTGSPWENRGTDAYGYLQDWSPDGAYLLMSVYEDPTFPGYCSELKEGLYKYDLESEESELIYPGLAASASWSADGQEIVFSAGDDIYIVGADGLNLENIHSGAGQVSGVTWSPDGNWIAFASNQSGNEDIFIINREGVQERQLTFDLKPDGSPDWSN